MKNKFAPLPFALDLGEMTVADPGQALTGGLSAEDVVRFLPHEELFHRHLAILGGSGNGKSKLMELICRHLLLNRRGFAFIDPHSTTSEDLLAFIKVNYAKLWPTQQRNIHYLNPSEKLFRFDPFQYHPVQAGNRDLPPAKAYQAWLHTQIKAMTEIILRQQGESAAVSDTFVQLKRWLYNGLYAVGVRLNEQGDHLPLRDILILLDPLDPRHDDRYQQVCAHLSDQVRRDFERLRNLKGFKQQAEITGSTYNRLRDILSPLVEEIFSDQGESINFREIISRGGVILASLKRDDLQDRGTALTIAGLLIHEITRAVMTIEVEQRSPFYLLIDEAHNYLGEDMIAIMKETRKFLLSFVIAVQDLENLKRGDLDLLPTVLSQCAVRITFQQQFHEHAEILAKSLCFRNLSFTPLVHEVIRPTGEVEWIWTPTISQSQSHSVSVQEAIGSSRSVSQSHTRSQNHSQSAAVGMTRAQSAGFTFSIGDSVSSTQGNSVSFSTGESVNISRSEANGTSNSSSSSESATRGRGQSSSERRVASISDKDAPPRQLTNQHSHQASQSQSQGKSVSHQSTETNSRSVSSSQNQSTGRNQSDSESHSHTRGRSSSRTLALNEQFSVTEGVSEGVSLGTSESTSHTFTTGESHSEQQGVSYALTPLMKYETILQQTGNLERSVSDQIAQWTHHIMSLAPQTCLVSVATQALSFPLRVATVRDPFAQLSHAFRASLIESLKQLIYQTHPYYIHFEHQQEDQPASEADPVDESRQSERDPDDPFDTTG